MTLDEAIKHYEDVAETCEFEASRCDETDRYEQHEMYELGKCAADHRQLAEWLTELKERREQPVKRGRWENPKSVGNGFIYCSVCRNEAYWDTDYGQQLFDYCPYCGAKMKKPKQ